MEFSAPNQFGQSNPIETPEHVATALEDLDAYLTHQVSKENKKSYVTACMKCPGIAASNAHKLLFLRSEVFRVNLAAIRLCKYWDMRIEIFGQEKAFLQMKLTQAMRDDHIAISMGIIMPLSQTDDEGREIVFFDPSKQDKTQYEPESLVRVFWYAAHVALESEEAQKKGVVLLIYPRNARHSQFDRKLASHIARSLKGCLPVRMGSFQVCHPPLFFKLIYPILKLLLGSYLRNRLRVNYGSDERVVSLLKGYGIPIKSIPNVFGGDVEVNCSKWLLSRKSIESTN